MVFDKLDIKLWIIKIKQSVVVKTHIIQGSQSQHVAYHHLRRFTR